MRLFLPIIADAILMLKARKGPRLIRKVRSVTRDGVTFQQAYWVLPGQAKEEDMPTGAQLDLFEREPDKPAPDPGPSVYLSQEPIDNPDEYTLKMRRLAADMAEYQVEPGEKHDGNMDVPYNYLREAFRDVRDKYDLPPNSAPNLLVGLSVAHDVSWDGVRRALRLVAAGELGADTGVNRHIVKSKYHDLPFEDIVRLFAGFYAGDHADRYKAGRLYEEVRYEHPGLDDIAYTIRNMKPEKAREVASGRLAFEYKSAGRRRKIFKAAVVAAAPADELPAGDPVDQVKALAAKGVTSYEDCIRIGKIITDAVGLSGNPDLERMREIAKEGQILYEEYKARWGKVERFRKKYSNVSLVDEDYYQDKYEKMRDECDAWEEKEYRPKIRALEKEHDAIREKLKAQGNAPTKAKEVLEFIAKVRPMGPSWRFMPNTLIGKPGDLRVAREAMSVFPTAWLEKMAEERWIFKNVAEGRGSCGGTEIKAPWKPGMTDHSKATQAHEIGHAIEKSNKLAGLCRQFVYSLADEGNDARIKNNRSAMRSWQKGLQSPDLPDEYCGVLYDWGDTEVVSMAAGALYEDHKGNLGRGLKYWQFILGLWAGV